MQCAHAGTSGYLEYSCLYNDNYNLAGDSVDKLSETVHTLSATLVQTLPVTYKTALLATGGFSHDWYSRFEDQTGTTYFLNGGVYHRWNYHSSFTGFVGGYRKNRENALQDQEGWSVRTNFVQKLSRKYWMNEQLFYERGVARILPDDYRGYGLSIWLHRQLENSSRFSAGVIGARKAYNDPLDRDITNYQLQVEWLYPFWKRYYTRTGASYTVAGSSGHYEHQSIIGYFALGYQF